MSRIGKKVIEVPKGVTATIEGSTVKVKGPKGELKKSFADYVTVQVEGNLIRIVRKGDGRKARETHGLARALVQNMVTGVSTGFTRTMDINGVGYRAEAKPGVITLTLGHSHPIAVLLPQGVTAKVDKNSIELTAIDKELLGAVSAAVRAQRAPEPYKGKGVKYTEEHIRRKVGKQGAK